MPLHIHLFTLDFNMIKKIIIRLLFLLLIVVASILVYNKFIWPIDRYMHADLLDALDKNRDSAAIIYIGESSNFWNAKEEHDKRSISEMIAENLEFPLLTLNKSAYHLGIYKPLFKHINKRKNVKHVVLTINLRTFGPPCVHGEFETSLQKDALFLSNQVPIVKKLKAVFNMYDNQSADDRNKVLWQHWTKDTLNLNGTTLKFVNVKNWCAVDKFMDSNNIEDMPKRVLADHYIKAFGFNLNAKNERVKDLDAIVALAEKQHYQLYLLIMSENIHWADSLAGKDLGNLIRTNRDYLVKRYQSSNHVQIIDNLETVKSAYFGEKDWTTEHYYWQGRKQIADSVSQVIKRNVVINKQQ